MEFVTAEGLPVLRFDLVFTLALAALFLFTGYGLRRRVPFLTRYSIPAAAIGGLLFAALVLLLRTQNILGVTIDSTLRAPLQTVFFTTIGFATTLGLLRAGGWQLPFFWLLASLAAVVQNLVGVGVARLIGAPPLLGIICGALTLTGGPATGLAFTESFERAGVTGAAALIIASATFGIFTSSLVGNPVATALIRRFRLTSPEAAPRRDDSRPLPPPVSAASLTEPALTAPVLLQNLCLILVVMGLGSWLSLALTRAGLTLPGYLGAMVLAALVRNADDRFRWFRLDARALEMCGAVALALFLVIALMDLKLWQLAGLAAPMLIILSVQIIIMILYAVAVTFTLMGRDYEAAVMASGHIGFGLGITPNAVANLEALTEKYGPAPRSFLVVPIVGASFIDFSNSLIILFSLQLLS